MEKGHKLSVKYVICHICRVCKASFYANRDSKYHSAQINEEKKQFECEICLKGFVSKYELKAHNSLDHEVWTPLGAFTFYVDRKSLFFYPSL